VSEVSDRTAMHKGLEQEVAATCELMMGDGRAVFTLVVVRQDDAYTVARDGRGEISAEVMSHLAKLLEREAATLRQRAADMIA
jgi:hypothetical protein